MIAEPLLPLARPVDGLKFLPGNPRRGDVAACKRSLQRFGQRKPIVVRDDGTVEAGNTTLRAAIELGWTEIACVAFGDDDATAKAFALADNRTSELGTFDAEALLAMASEVDAVDPELLLAASYDLAELTGRREGKTDPDAVPEPPAEPVTQPGDLWLLGEHRLLCGDAASATDHERLLNGVSAGLALTSFPYGVGLDYGTTYQDDLENLRRLLAEVPPLVYAALSAGGYFVTNFADIVSAMSALSTDEPCEYPAAVDYWPAFRAAGFLLQSRRIWAKPHGRVTAPWTSNSNRAACDWEHIWTWKKPGRGLSERREPSYFGVWDSSRLEGVDVGKDIHPAAFPVGIAATVLRVYTNRGDAVLDPFMGTGTTLIAAHQERRTAYGCEISAAYCDVICRRFQEHTGTKPVLEATGEPHDFT